MNCDTTRSTRGTPHEDDIKKEKRFLKYNYTGEEKNQMGSELARLTAQIQEKTANAKAVAAQLKAEIDRLKAEMEDTAHRYNAGCEHRNVECQLVYYWGDGVKQITRLDTGEVLPDERIREEERQGRLV